MIWNIRNFITNLFKTPENNEVTDIKEIVFYETNLYREMLGLSHLDQDPVLGKVAVSFCEGVIKGSFSDDDVLNSASKTHGISQYFDGFRNRELWASRSIFPTPSKLEYGLIIVKLLQLSDTDNPKLISSNMKAVGWGCKRGLYQITNSSNGVLKETDSSKKGLYMSLIFFSSDEPTLILEQIEITEEIKSHLTKYVGLVHKELNNFLTGGECFDGDKFKERVTNDAYLNEVAEEELNLQQQTDGEHNSLVGSFKDKCSQETGFSKVQSEIFYFNNYIPPIRLIYREEGIRNKIKEIFKDTEINSFGMKVLLFEDKSFKVSVIFAKKKLIVFY
ncbi:hypothetical protein CDIK_2259 [Cucumispora dikerogammari]|nr:hypothetical protein CDIK_2259 [Cucumispora dikerogammari]